MSETQTPAPAPQKKYLLDNPVLRGLLDVVALGAPAPLLLVLVNFWLECIAPAEQKTLGAIEVFKQIFDGSGQPPMWALPVAFIPSVALLVILHRKTGGKLLLALIVMLAISAAETFYFTQMTPT